MKKSMFLKTNKKNAVAHTSLSDLTMSRKSLILGNKIIRFFLMDCYGHNFVIIGSILEILDVLSSPNRVASNFGTLCDNGRLLGDNSRRFRDSDHVFSGFRD